MTMRTTVRLFLLLVVLTAPSAAFAQGEPDWLVDTLYGSGKINTVVAVVSVILLGLALWLFRLDRRIARIEQRTK
ncbi:MAG: CcmD family protein [Flavobacteriales bacterium]|nr:CcmD family protein [Flavobacteriales bacterium]